MDPFPLASFIISINASHNPSYGWGRDPKGLNYLTKVNSQEIKDQIIKFKGTGSS
jgi:hypothetical protein